MCKHPDCAVKYVGKTTLALNRRLSLHRGNMVAGKEAVVMLNHFTKIHQPSDMQIKAIEACDKRNLEDRERYWINELNVAFPYGLNDRLSKKGVQDVYTHVMDNCANNIPVYELFNKIPSKRTKKGGRKRNGSNLLPVNDTFDACSFMVDLLDLSYEDKTFFVHYVRNKVMHLNKDYTKKLFIHLAVVIKDGKELFNTYSTCSCNNNLPYLVKDLCLAKLRKSFIPKSSNQHFIVFTFVNKLLNSVNINKVLKMNSISNLFPINDTELKYPGIAFRYSDTIRTQVLNYKQVIQEGITPVACDCHSLDPMFIDEHSGHAFTGNLNIISNEELRRLFKKGLKYREVPLPNKEKVKASLQSGLDTYISKVSSLNKVSASCFTGWKTEILKLLDMQIDKLLPYNYNNVLSKKQNKDDLSKLQSKFVFIPTDKASNNITVVCKKHYMEVLDTEILNSNTFNEVGDTISDISNNHKEFVTKWKLSTSGNIPYLYWISKLHKTPISNRFITSGKGGSLEKLSQVVGYCLKGIMKIILSDSKYYQKETGINKCFVINNKDPILQYISKSNQEIGNNTLKTFDFEKLYTSIPQIKLKEQISSVVRGVFTSRKKFFISVSGKHAYLSKKRGKSLFSVSMTEFIKCINFIIDNGYITYKGRVFRQVCGIPMGTNCAPYLANLFLHSYEIKYIEDAINTGQLDIAKSLNAVFRYQDDCIVFNDNNVFSDKVMDIYPVEMVLKETNVSQTMTHYLDLTVSYTNGKYEYKSYDKRSDFNFDVINYPDLSGNIPLTQSYGVFMSQTIRFCEINSSYDDFKKDMRILIDKLVVLGFKIKTLKTKFIQFYHSQINLWSKFGCDIIDLIYLFSNNQ